MALAAKGAIENKDCRASPFPKCSSVPERSLDLEVNYVNRVTLVVVERENMPVIDEPENPEMKRMKALQILKIANLIEAKYSG